MCTFESQSLLYATFYKYKLQHQLYVNIHIHNFVTVIVVCLSAQIGGHSHILQTLDTARDNYKLTKD